MYQNAFHMLRYKSFECSVVIDIKPRSKEDDGN